MGFGLLFSGEVCESLRRASSRGNSSMSLSSEDCSECIFEFERTVWSYWSPFRLLPLECPGSERCIILVILSFIGGKIIMASLK